MKRRNFLSTTALLGTTTLAGGGVSLLSGCSADKTSKMRVLTNEELNLPPLLDKAPEGKNLKVGLIGCGGRGTGAAGNLLS
ncbi:MAG: oxidoreductase, partial [Tannerella sp.]|nr:oxidoreductase [Tannerella sp.]